MKGAYLFCLHSLERSAQFATSFSERETRTWPGLAPPAEAFLLERTSREALASLWLVGATSFLTFDTAGGEGTRVHFRVVGQ